MKRVVYLYFTLPSLLLLTIVVLYPLGYSVWVSFFYYYLPSPSSRQFVGLKNYVSIILNPDLHHALRITLFFTSGSVSMQLVFGLIIALLLNKIEVGRRTLSTVIFLPVMVTPVVAGLILKWMFIEEWGMVNYFLELVGIRGLPWLSNGFYALLAVMLADVWQYTPFCVIVLLAGLRALPLEPIEAAIVDGASRLKMLWYIILPLLKPLILFIVIIRTMDAFRVFDKVYAMTAGGPGSATEMITIFNYRLAFKMFQVGKGAAVGAWTLLFLLGPICAYLYLLYEKE